MSLLRRWLGIDQPPLEDAMDHAVYPQSPTATLQTAGEAAAAMVDALRESRRDDRAPGDTGQVELPADPSRGSTLPSEIDRKRLRVGVIGGNITAIERRTPDEITSDLLLDTPSGDHGRIEGQNKAQQLESAIHALQGENQRLQAERMALPSSDAHADLNQVRALLAAAPGESTVDAVMRLLKTNRIVDGLPSSLPGRLMHMDLRPEQLDTTLAKIEDFGKTESVRLEQLAAIRRELAKPSLPQLTHEAKADVTTRTKPKRKRKGVS